MQNNSISTYFWNEEYNSIDIKGTPNTAEFPVSDYILTLLMHSSFKSFDGGETFSGSIINSLTTENSMQFQGNLEGVIKNVANAENQQNLIIDEIRSCLKTGIDKGIFALTTTNDIILTIEKNKILITINVIINKLRKSFVYYFDKTTNNVKLVKK